MTKEHKFTYPNILGPITQSSNFIFYFANSRQPCKLHVLIRLSPIMTQIDFHIDISY